MTTTNPAPRSLDVATTIASQIGNRALMMFGARDLAGDATSLHFKIGRNARGVTHVRVTLDPSDTYTVTFLRIGRAPRFDRAELGSESFLYADQLRSTIGTFAGLYWTL